MHSKSTAGQPMSRNPLAQHRQAAAVFLDSVARAKDYQRRERANFLDFEIVADPAGFDLDFLAFYREDKQIVLFLSDAGAKRGLELIQPLEVQ